MISYMVEVNTYDYDSGHYHSEWRQYHFENADKANLFYDMIISLNYDAKLVGRPCALVYYGTDEKLASILGFFYGGVFKETPRLYRITTEKVERYATDSEYCLNE
jgi:hypothetical protein